MQRWQGRWRCGARCLSGWNLRQFTAAHRGRRMAASKAHPRAHPTGGVMFERLERSFELVKASATILRQDKELVLFPLISGASLVAVMLAFALPAFGLASLDSVQMYNEAGKSSPLWYIFGF